jgi:hypothetical protein
MEFDGRLTRHAAEYTVEVRRERCVRGDRAEIERLIGRTGDTSDTRSTAASWNERVSFLRREYTKCPVVLDCRCESASASRRGMMRNCGRLVHGRALDEIAAAPEL